MLTFLPRRGRARLSDAQFLEHGFQAPEKCRQIVVI
jgi:hypothetical protein